MSWSTDPPTVVQATRKGTDEQVLALCSEVAGERTDLHRLPPLADYQAEPERVHELLRTRLGDFDRFAMEIADYLHV